MIYIEKENKISTLLQHLEDHLYLFTKITGLVGVTLKGHMLLNEAAKGILKSIYIANKLYVPHEKWLVHYCRDLDWLPTNWGETKTKLLSTQDMSMRSLVERQAVFHSVWNEINDYIREEYFDGMPADISTKHHYDLIKLLVEKKKIPTNEWLMVSSLKAVNEDPLNKFVTIKEGWVCFDEEAFRNLLPDSMYYWHFKAVHELQ